MQTCGRCKNGVIAQPSVPITNAGPDLNYNYNYDWQWQNGRATNYGAPIRAHLPPCLSQMEQVVSVHARTSLYDLHIQSLQDYANALKS